MFNVRNLSVVIKNVATYVKEKGINLSKMDRDTKIPYSALYSSLCDDERERELRADEFLGICQYLEIDPRNFQKTSVEKGGAECVDLENASKKRQYSEEMYQRWLSGLIGLAISTVVYFIAVIASIK